MLTFVGGIPVLALAVIIAAAAVLLVTLCLVIVSSLKHGSAGWGDLGWQLVGLCDTSRQITGDNT